MEYNEEKDHDSLGGLTPAEALEKAGNSTFEVSTWRGSLRGVILQDEYFDVIHVYGFSDNQEVARQLTEFLEQEEPDAYFYHLAEE